MHRCTLALICLAGALVGQGEAACHRETQNCVLEYGTWSECNPCTGLSSRHITIKVPAHHDGKACPEKKMETRACQTDRKCPPAPQCPTDKFDCKLRGKFIDPRLRCNGDDDCGNNEDEKNCSSQTLQLSRSMQECLDKPLLPYLDQLGQGFDTNSGRLVGRVLDHQRFEGMCRHAFDEQKQYRMPYNMHEMRFAADSSNDIESKQVHSFDQLLDDAKADTNTVYDIDTGLGFVFTGGNNLVNFFTSQSEANTMEKVHKGMTNQNSRTFKFATKIGVGQFVLRDDALMLDSYFLDRLTRLPDTYDAHAYFSLFEQFGTMYMHSGKLGGSFENLYMFNTDDMKREGLDEKATSKCMQYKVKLEWGATGSSVTNDGHFDFDWDDCAAATNKKMSAASVASLADTKFTKVLGGTAAGMGKLQGAATVMEGNKLQSVKFSDWVSSVKTNPAVVERQLRPICRLLAHSGVANATAKTSACMEATAVYMRPHSADHCRPCLNGGRAFNLGQQCKCACQLGFTGDTCAENVRAMNQAKQMFGTKLASTPMLMKLAMTHENASVNVDPPLMDSVDVGAYDEVIKARAGVIYLLSGDGLKAQTRYAIRVFDELLKETKSVAVDFSSIDECQTAGVMCAIRDFDVDMEDGYVISVKVWNPAQATEGGRTVLYRLNNEGKSSLKIAAPCAKTDEQLTDTSFVTTTCDGRILVSCPNRRTATVKSYDVDGKPLAMLQFHGFSTVTSIQVFKDRLWLHTVDGAVGAFSTDSWQEQLRLPLSTTEGRPTERRTQLGVDQADNVVVGQETSAVAFRVLDADTNDVLLRVKLTQWHRCHSVVVYRGKLYTLCRQRSDDAKRQILVFDYLK